MHKIIYYTIKLINLTYWYLVCTWNERKFCVCDELIYKLHIYDEIVFLKKFIVINVWQWENTWVISSVFRSMDEEQEPKPWDGYSNEPLFESESWSQSFLHSVAVKLRHGLHLDPFLCIILERITEYFGSEARGSWL